ncbi:retrovirus-related pol polyprotein from transposon TNT 1-94 [Tanacetum coccineum]
MERESFFNNQNALEIPEYFENNDMKAQLQAKDTTICKLKEHIKSMRENVKEEKVKHEMDKIETINIGLEYSVAKLLSENERMFKIDLEPLAPRLLNNREAHIDYLKYTQEQADILQGIGKQAKAKQPLDNALDFACKHAKRIQELLVDVRDTCPNTFKPRLKCSTSTCRSQPTGNKRNDRISQKPIRNRTNKVEAQPRKVNKKNHVKEPICNDNVKHTMLNANSQLICIKCKQCMFDANHDVCFLDFVNDVNMHAKSKSKSKKSQVHNIWKPTGKVFTDVGLKWKPTGRLFTIVGNSCPLTRITPKKIVHRKETTSSSVETQKPEIKVYSRRPKQIKSGSNATDVPSSSSLANDRGVTGTLNKLAKDGLVRGIPKLKFQKDHLCSACTLGKSKKTSHQPKAEDINQEKLYLLHMDLCGPMRVESINGKKYILVIVDDYSRFTWVRFLRSKDEAPEAIIKCIKNIQVRLNTTVRNVRTDNGTEFVNQILREFYENVGISHQTSVARTPQQNGVFERRNHTLVEAARTMLIFLKALLFLWAEAINTACYTQNHSLIRLRYNKTSYELTHDKKPDLSFLHVFGSLCYPTNDSEDLGKLNAKADIGIFVGYAPAKKDFRIYNRRTRKIMETIHVTFDELTAMASKQFGSGPRLQ